MAAHDVLVVGETLMNVHDDGMSIRERVGGSAGNVAVGLARLGRDVMLHTSLGQDERGEDIAAYLASEGVGLSASSFGAGATSVVRAVPRFDGSTAWDYRVRWAPAVDPGTFDARCVHAGSWATQVEPGASVVRDLVAQAYGRSLVTFDARVEPTLVASREAAVRRVDEFVELAGIVRTSERDLAFLYPDVAPIDVLRDWVARGPDLVVVTRGSHGATAVTARCVVDVPAVAVLFADEAGGAGDAFMASLIDTALTFDADVSMRWLRSGTPVVEQVLARSVRAAALTVSRVGAVPPTAEELMPASTSA